MGVFVKDPAEQLDYTFDFTALLTAISQTITGTPTITITPSGSLAQTGSTVIDGTTKKATVVLTGGTEGVEYKVTCTVTSTGSPARIFKDGFFVIVGAQPPAEHANSYTTVAALQARLGVTDEAQIDLFAQYIDQASRIVEGITGRVFYRQIALEEKVSIGRPTKYMMLNNIPVTDIVSIEFDDEILDEADYELYSGSSGIVFNNDRWESSACNDGKRYTVIYDCGYILPGSANSNLPADIQQATLELCKMMYFTQDRDLSIKEEEVHQVYRVKYGSPNSGSQGQGGDGVIPVEVASLLERYKAIRL